MVQGCRLGHGMSRNPSWTSVWFGPFPEWTFLPCTSDPLRMQLPANANDVVSIKKWNFFWNMSWKRGLKDTTSTTSVHISIPAFVGMFCSRYQQLRVVQCGACVFRQRQYRHWRYKGEGRGGRSVSVDEFQIWTWRLLRRALFDWRWAQWKVVSRIWWSIEWSWWWGMRGQRKAMKKGMEGIGVWEAEGSEARREANSRRTEGPIGRKNTKDALHRSFHPSMAMERRTHP